MPQRYFRVELMVLNVMGIVGLVLLAMLLLSGGRL